MYKASSTRARKTNITRTKSGCAHCRRKRRKCDEGRPSCKRCVGAGVDCEYGITLEFRDATQWAAHRVERAKRTTKSSQSTAAAGTSIVPSASASKTPIATSPEISKSQRNSPESQPSPSHLEPGNACMQPQPAMSESNHPMELEQIECNLFDDMSSALAPTLPPVVVGLGGHGIDFSLQWLSQEPIQLDLSQDWQTICASNNIDPDSCPQVLATSDYLEGVTDGTKQPSMMILDPLSVMDFSFQNGLQHAGWTHDKPMANSPLESQGSSLDLSAAYDYLELSDAAIPSPSTTSSSKHAQSARSPENAGSMCLQTQPPLQRQTENLPLPRNSVVSQALDGSRPLLSTLAETCPPLEVAIGDRLYLAHFRVNIIDILPLYLDNLYEIALAVAPIHYAALALAGANLANQRGAQSPDGRGTWVPMPAHAEKALKFLRKCDSSIQTNFELSVEVQVVRQTLIVCYYIELGTIADIQNAIQSLDDIILRHSNDILTLAQGENIVRCWLNLRSLHSFIKSPHTPYGNESPQEGLVVDLERRVATSRDTINYIGTKALTIFNRILLFNCMRSRGDTATDALKKSGNWWNILKGGQDVNPYDNAAGLHSTMNEEDLTRELDTLKQSMEKCQVPAEFPPTIEETAIFPQSAAAITPLHFSSHELAMECADYAFARLLCDQNLAQRLLSKVPKTNCNQIQQFPPHLHLLYRIARGLDPVDWSKRNMYRKGITAYLYHATLLTVGSAGLGLFHSFLEGCIKAGTLYEGGFWSFSGFSLFVEALIRETSTGRSVLMACLTYGISAPKELLFSKGIDQYLMIFGREVDGKYFNDLGPLASSS